MRPFFLDGERGKALIGKELCTKTVTATYSFWDPPNRKIAIFSFDEVGFADDGCTIVMKNDMEGIHVFTCLNENYTEFKSLIERYSEGKKMCKEFLHKFGKFREGEEEKYNFFEDMRLCTERDCPLKVGGITYSPPAGWYRIRLNQNENIPDTWDYGYHGTRTEFVGSILRNGFLVPGNRTATGTLIKVRSDHVQGMRQIYTSPSLHYAGHYIYAQPTEFHYTQEDGNEKTYYVRTVFQVRQKPGTYRIQRNTIHPLNWDPKVRMDDAFTNDELEWYTTDSSTVIPVGLLLHFSEVPIEDVYEMREKGQRRKYPEQMTFEDSRNLVQENFTAEKKKKILWVDDYPQNNAGLICMIDSRGVGVDLCLSTDYAVKKVLEEGSDAYCIAITDMRRIEQRENDDEPKDYSEAGLDFIRIAKGYGWNFPIYLYSSYARARETIMRASIMAGAEKVCTYEDMKYIIEEGSFSVDAYSNIY